MMRASLWLRVLAILLIVGCGCAVLAQEDESENGKPEAKAKELPLKATDKVEFNTDEGTWMSLDMSPDGKTIVFDLLGDIYTIPASGGAATRIIGGISFESQPKFSPDGKSLAFLSDRGGAEALWLANADGSNPHPLTKDRNQGFLSPSWTPDGKWILVSRHDPSAREYSLWMYDKDGGTGIRLGGPAPHQPEEEEDETGPRRRGPNRYGPVASPDGKFIYFAQRTGLFSYNVQFPLWQIHRFDRRTSEVSTLTEAQGSAMRPILSPDGKFLVYATRYETGTALKVRDLETGEERWLLHPVTRDDQESVASRDLMPGYTFTPDGKNILMTLNGKIALVDFQSGKPSFIPFTANVQAEIAPRLHFEYKVDDSPTLKARLIRWPALSPDGKRVVFSALNKLWIMDLPGGKPRRVTQSSEGEFMPAWSPDGKSLAYVTWSAAGGNIQRVSADGGEPQTLTRRSAYYSEPAFSPDGKKIVFITGRRDEQLYADLHMLEQHTEEADVPDDAMLERAAEREVEGISPEEGFDLRWIPAEGGDTQFIAPAQGGHHPHFAGDSERVYLTTRRGLTSVRLDGLDRRVELKLTGTTPGPRPPAAEDVVVSPDGNLAFVNLENKHYLVPVPHAGKEMVTVSIKGKAPASVDVKKMSPEGGDYLGWSSDGKYVTWAWGADFYRQAIDSDKPEKIEISIEAPRYKPQGTVALTGARIVTMKGDEVIENGTIVIRDNRIAAVGSKTSAIVPPGAKVIDVRGKTIIPGLVDVHSHMWPPRGVHQTQVWQYLANLAFGVTTTRDPQSSTNDVFAYSDLVETGDIIGPRVFSTGPGVFSSSGIDSAEAALNFLKRYKNAYHTDTLKEYMTGDRIVRQWVAMACKELQITPTTEGALDMKLDLSQMADGFSGNEHTLPLEPLYKDVVQYVARTKTFYTPTTLVAYGAPWSENFYFESTDVHSNMKLRRFIPHELLDTMVKRRGQWFLPEEYGHQAIAKGVADVVHAGGHAGLGGHGQMQGLGDHWELWDIGSGGLTPLETLRVGTLFGAQALGLDRDLGSLEVGKLADLVVLDRNPLQDIHNTLSIKYVMKNGVMYEGDTLDQVYPQQKRLDAQYWWNMGPAPDVATPKSGGTPAK